MELLEVKTHIPLNCRKSVERRYLLRSMLQYEGNMMILRGNAGYGKTETAVQYCEKCKRRVCWYSLDQRDNDEVVFLSYLDAVLSRELSGYRENTEGDLSCTKEEASTFAIQMLQRLSHILCEHSDEKYLIVFDNLDRIQNKFIFDILQIFLDIIPHNLQTLFIIRRGVPDFFSRYIMGGGCKLIDETDLAFSDEEQRILIKQVLGCDEQDTDRICKECSHVLEGWPAGYMLALICLKKKELWRKPIDWHCLLRDSFINSFLSCEIYRKLPEPIRDFLVKTSAMTELNDKMCDMILSIEDSKAIIKRLYRENLFLYSVYGRKGGIRFHSVFRMFLIEMSDNRIQFELAKKAAEYYWKEGELKQAMEQGIEIEYTELIVKIIEEYGQELLDHDADGVLEQGIRYLEEGVRLLGEHESRRNYELITDDVRRVAAEFHRRGIYKERPDVKDHKGLLRANMFGDFYVFAGAEGRPLSWRTKKGKELFALLITLDGEGIDRKKLIQKLWNDEAPDRAVTMLHNMLYHIRKQLAPYHMQDLICFKEKKYYMNMKMIETDMERIKKLCALIDREDINALVKKADSLKTYWGRFLDDIDCVWAIDQKEYYDTRFAQGCTLLAEYNISYGTYEDAVLFLKNALIINAFSEDLVCRLLVCYSALGEFQKVKEEYERFTKFLKNELDVEPGERLRMTYKRALYRKH